jgi:ABC-type sugar transport system permease subunit
MKLKNTLENYIFILPAVSIFAVFYVIPFIWVFQLGLYEWDGISFTKIFKHNNFIKNARKTRKNKKT